MSEEQAAGGGGGQAPSSTGLEPNIAAFLANLLGPVTGLIFVLIEKENRFVKFHAWQALLFGGAYIAVQILLMLTSSVTLCLGGIVALGVAFVGFFIWLLLMFKAFQNQKFKLPILGDMAEQQANK